MAEGIECDSFTESTLAFEAITKNGIEDIKATAEMVDPRFPNVKIQLTTYKTAPYCYDVILSCGEVSVSTKIQAVENAMITQWSSEVPNDAK